MMVILLARSTGIVSIVDGMFKARMVLGFLHNGCMSHLKKVLFLVSVLIL